MGLGCCFDRGLSFILRNGMYESQPHTARVRIGIQLLLSVWRHAPVLLRSSRGELSKPGGCGRPDAFRQLRPLHAHWGRRPAARSCPGTHGWWVDSIGRPHLLTHPSCVSIHQVVANICRPEKQTSTPSNIFNFVFKLCEKATVLKVLPSNRDQAERMVQRIEAVLSRD